MKLVQKNVLMVAGVISAVVGITMAVPAFLQSKFLLAILSVILIIFGLVLLAIGLGD